MAYLGMTDPDLYRQAIRSGLAVTYTIDASVGGTPVAGATGMTPTGGSITDTTKAGVRRVLNLELAPEPGLYDLLSPEGTQLTVTAHVEYTNRTVVDIPMGVFEVDTEKISDGGGGLSLTAPDKWGRIQRAKFVIPQASSPGTPVSQMIAALIRGALGASEPVNVLTTAETVVGVLTWDDDREKAIQELAESIGAWVYFDRSGVATVAPVPTPEAGASWLVDASATGVLTELDRERSRASTRNVVVVTSSSAEQAPFAPQVVWDSDPASPTYAGTDPVNHPETAGPFGISVHRETTSLPLTNDEAQVMAYTILHRVVGIASQVSMGQVPNPAVDAFDIADVIPPYRTVPVIVGYTGGGGSGFGVGPFGTAPFGAGDPGTGAPIIDYAPSGATMERHVCDTVSHPLTVGQAQHIDGRSTRTDL